jgi:hypothetical protein
MKSKLFYLFVFLFALSEGANAQSFVGFQNAFTDNLSSTSARANFQTRVANGSSAGTWTVRYSLASNMSNPIVVTSGSSPLSGTWVSRNANITYLQPNTTYYWQATGVVGNTTSLSQIISFTTTPPILPTVSVNTANTGVDSASINYTVNAGGAATTTELKYGTNPNDLNLSKVGFNASGATNISNTISIANLTGGTTYYLRVEATNSAGTTSSILYNFTTQAALAPLLVQTNINPLGFTGAIVSFTGNSRGSNTTPIVNYGLSEFELNLSVTGANFAMSGNNTFQIELPNLTSSTTYYIQLTLTNAVGSVSSQIISFTTPTPPQELTIANYTFNNTYSNLVNGTDPFSTPNTTFVADRNNVSNNAIRIGSTSVPATATITNLPTGNAARTVSFWFKKPAHTAPIGLFSYGANASLQTFGMYLGNNGNYWFQGFSTDHNFGGSSAANTWIHVALTYTPGILRLYINGALQGVVNLNLNTASSVFRLGGAQGIIEFDDLQIYNYELAATQIVELYNTNQFMAIPNFTQIASICSGSELLPLLTTSNNGISGTWSPELNNQATTTYTFIPNDGQNATQQTMQIVVNPLITPSFTSVEPICSGTTLAALPTTSNNGISGTWSPALNNEATTTYTFTPSAGQCANTQTLTITINPSATPTFTAVEPICSGTTLTALPTTSNNGISGTWFPALNNQATTTYTFTPSEGQCANAQTLTIAVNTVQNPMGESVQVFNEGATLENIVVSPSSVVWFATQDDAINNVNSLPLSTVLDSNATYYAVSELGECRSNPFAVTVSITLGIDGVVFSDLKVYPNPVRDILTIETNETITSVEIYSIQGQKLMSSNQKQIDFSSMPAGVFLVKIKSTNQTEVTQKIVKN